MGDIIELENTENRQETSGEIITGDEAGYISGTDDILNGIEEIGTDHSTMNVPVAQLATLGAGISSLIPALRTVTQTTTFSTENLYRIINAAPGDVLKLSKSKEFAWGAMQTASGSSKMVRLASAGPLSSTTESTAALNPAMLMLAVALFSIERQLGEISEMEKKIISFLKAEKEAEIKADIQTLGNMISKYKYNWDNEPYLSSNHKMALDIERTARKNITIYKKQVEEAVNSRNLLVARSKVTSSLQDLTNKFRYYRLSLYSFAMASFMEIMLSGNFKEEYVSGIKAEVEGMSIEYRSLYSKCSAHLERMTGISVERNLLKGLGTASDTVGRLIGKIPYVEKGSVDEFLQESGKHMKQDAEEMITRTIASFAEVKDPATRVFIEKMQDMIQIYNHTTEVRIDSQNVYLIAG